MPHYIHADRSSPLTDLERVFWHQDEPCHWPQPFSTMGAQPGGWQSSECGLSSMVLTVIRRYRMARRVSLNLPTAGNWETFAQEAEAVSHHLNVSPHKLLQGYGLAAVEELAKKQRWMAFAAALNQINRFFQASRRELLWRHG